MTGEYFFEPCTAEDIEDALTEAKIPFDHDIGPRGLRFLTRNRAAANP